LTATNIASDIGNQRCRRTIWPKHVSHVLIDKAPTLTVSLTNQHCTHTESLSRSLQRSPKSTSLPILMLGKSGTEKLSRESKAQGDAATRQPSKSILCLRRQCIWGRCLDVRTHSALFASIFWQEGTLSHHIRRIMLKFFHTNRCFASLPRARNPSTCLCVR